MDEVKPNCFVVGGGDKEICARCDCSVVSRCIWRRKPEEGGRGPPMPDLTPGSGKMEGGKPILRR